MTFLFKLSRRVARLRTPTALLVAALVLAACDSPDGALSGPTVSHPSFATATGFPAGVTDLAVAATTDTSAILTFAEVDDGLGAPATYDIRVAATPLVWSGTVPSVTRGTCATPFGGAVIGATRVCSVLGLTAGTRYDFQLVAFRGTLKVDAVFGGLSNVATGTTAGAAVASVASVSVAPGTAMLAVGNTRQLATTLTDAGGNVLTDRTIWWASSNAAVANVSGRGLVTALAPGVATITATSGTTAGRAAITVTAPVLTVPGTVSDLKVAGVTDTVVTLSFTEVTDGSGRPANYNVRYALGPTLSWGASTPSVTRGTCGTALTGTAIGAKRTCTVLGLGAATTYSFELVAYRGTLLVNAVFGGLSNVTSGTTAAAPGGGSAGGGGGQGTSYFNSNFENGTLGDLGVYPGNNGTCGVTTEAARTGTRAAKCVTTASTSAEGALWYTWGNKPGEPANPALSETNGYYQKFSIMYAPGSFANVHNGGSNAQFKMLLNRSDWHYGFEGAWFMTSWGANYGTWPPLIENNGDNCSGLHWNWPFVLQEGVWYDITTWFKRDPTTHTGHAKMWVNGVLLTDTDVMAPAYDAPHPRGLSCLGSDNAGNQQQFEVGATYTQNTVGPFTVYVDDVQAANYPIGAATQGLVSR